MVTHINQEAETTADREARLSVDRVTGRVAGGVVTIDDHVNSGPELEYVIAGVAKGHWPFAEITGDVAIRTETFIDRAQPEERRVGKKEPLGRSRSYGSSCSARS
jgi:hypothetical protein